MHHGSPFGNLKEAAARPGPSSYNVQSTALAPDGGAPFGKAKRMLTTDTSSTAAYANALGKEKAFEWSHLPEEDELDALISKFGAIGRPGFSRLLRP